MARTVRKTPTRRDRRTAERHMEFAPGPWFVPGTTPLQRWTSDDIIAAQLPRRIPTRFSLVRSGRFTPLDAS